MLSVADMLNPVKAERKGTPLPSSPTSSSRKTASSTLIADDSPSSTCSSTAFAKKSKMSKDGAIFAKGKAKGQINFPPFEDLDAEALKQVEKFSVYPLGKIREFCRHIPYNSEKKNFLGRTGRESFEGTCCRLQECPFDLLAKHAFRRGFYYPARS